MHPRLFIFRRVHQPRDLRDQQPLEREAVVLHNWLPRGLMGLLRRLLRPASRRVLLLLHLRHRHHPYDRRVLQDLYRRRVRHIAVLQCAGQVRQSLVPRRKNMDRRRSHDILLRGRLQ